MVTIRRTGIAEGLLVLGIVGFVGLAPSAAATIETSASPADPGPCVAIDTTGPGVRVDPWSCKKQVEDLIVDPPPQGFVIS